MNIISGAYSLINAIKLLNYNKVKLKMSNLDDDYPHEKDVNLIKDLREQDVKIKVGTNKCICFLLFV